MLILKRKKSIIQLFLQKNNDENCFRNCKLASEIEKEANFAAFYFESAILHFYKTKTSINVTISMLP